jgi:hypothetical protein
MSELSPEGQAFAAKFRAGEYGHSGLVPEPYVPEPLSPEGQAFAADYRADAQMRHLARMQNEYEYRQNVLKLRKDCDKCDMDIANTLTCKGSSCSVMGGKRRSKKHCKKHSKKNRRRCTTSRRRSRARRSI